MRGHSEGGALPGVMNACPIRGEGGGGEGHEGSAPKGIYPQRDIQEVQGRGAALMSTRGGGIRRRGGGSRDLSAAYGGAGRGEEEGGRGKHSPRRSNVQNVLLEDCDVVALRAQGQIAREEIQAYFCHAHQSRRGEGGGGNVRSAAAAAARCAAISTGGAAAALLLLLMRAVGAILDGRDHGHCCVPPGQHAPPACGREEGAGGKGARAKGATCRSQETRPARRGGGRAA